MTNNTINNVPRQLLERAVQIPSKASVEENHAAIVDRGRAQAEIRTLLSTPSPAGVDGLVAVKVWEADADWDDHELVVRLSAAQAIIDGLRGENERIRLNIAEYNEAISCYQSERDQQAQRIGELEWLLLEVNDTYRAAIHWEDLRGTMKRIDSALSAGKDSDQ